MVIAAGLVGAGSASAKFSGVEGHWLAFERARPGQSDIFVAKPGAAGVNLTQSAATEGQPAWGDPPIDADCTHASQVPQHQRLAFDSRAPGGHADIFLVEVAGLEATPPAPALAAAPINITNTLGVDDTSPAWGPGFVPPGGGPALKLIAFTSDRDANQDGRADRDIFIADETGANVVNVTHNDSDDANPEWSPDRTRIAFESTRSGTRQIWAVPITLQGGHATAGAPYQVTRGPDPKRDPTWLGHSPPFGSNEPQEAQIVYGVEQGGRSYLDAITQDITAEFPDPFGPFTGPSPVVVQEITGDPGDDTAPSWSSGAYAVVFATTAGGTVPSLRILRGSENSPLTVEPGPVVLPGGDDTNADWQPFDNCAAPHPRMPAPAPPRRTAKPGAAGAGGGSTGSSGSNGPAGGGRGRGNGVSRLSLRRVSVTASGRGGRRRVIVRLTVNRRARATVRLRRGSHVAARGSYRLHVGANRMGVGVPRRARRGVYRVIVKVRASETLTVVRRVRLGS